LIASPLVSYSPALPPYLPSFPTRRSSDLVLLGLDKINQRRGGGGCADVHRFQRQADALALPGHGGAAAVGVILDRDRHAVDRVRSEEHTSELQSRFDLVCRLLLEKKKQQT